MSLSLANRISDLKPSPTLTLNAKAKQLQAEGKDIINLTVGEPDFDTPEHIKNAAIEALKAGFTKYTPVEGIPTLKQAIVDKLKKGNNLEYTSAQIIVSCGVKHSLYNLAQVLLNPGDEVIIPAPYWVSYPDIVLLAQGKSIFIETSYAQNFKINPEQLEAAITPKTRLILLNSPSNPTGIAYTAAELTALGEVLRYHPNIIIATDDIYEKILWREEPFSNILNVCPDLYERTIVLNGVSKSYAMTGWRIGYAAGPQAIIKAMADLQSQSTSNPNSIAQVAAQVALTSEQSCVTIMNQAYQERHAYLYKELSNMPYVQCRPADGTFYIFPSIQLLLSHSSKLSLDMQAAEYLLNQAGLAVVPGSVFGAPGCLRISFATDLKQLKIACERLQECFAKLNP